MPADWRSSFWALAKTTHSNIHTKISANRPLICEVGLESNASAYLEFHSYVFRNAVVIGNINVIL